MGLLVFVAVIEYLLGHEAEPFAVELDFVVDGIKTLFPVFVFDPCGIEQFLGFPGLLLAVAGFDDIFAPLIHFRTALFEAGDVIHRLHQRFLKLGDLPLQHCRFFFLIGDLRFSQLQFGRVDLGFGLDIKQRFLRFVDRGVELIDLLDEHRDFDLLQALLLLPVDLRLAGLPLQGADLLFEFGQDILAAVEILLGS